MKHSVQLGAVILVTLAVCCPRIRAEKDPPVFIPDATHKGDHVVLDLASGQMLAKEASGAQQLIGHYHKLGKGDLAYVRTAKKKVLICL